MLKINQLFREFVGHLSEKDHAHALGHYGLGIGMRYS
jgi:hypothetical protein